VVLSFHLSDATSAAATKGLERKLWGLLLGQADAIVIPSSDLGKVLLEVNPACAPAILTVPNGVDYPLFHQPQPLPENWPAVLRGRRVIVSVGGFEPRKGHALLLEAVSKLKKDYPDLGLVIIGTDRPERRDLEAQRAALGLEQDAFFYTGIPHDQLGAYLQQGFLFALATESETFCLAILEAGAAGLPVISTIAPGVVEVIENGITGRLVPVGNVEALEKAVRQVIEESELTAHMKQEFARRIQANWTLDHQYKHYKDLYRRLK
jgi:mannosyltransferase